MEAQKAWKELGSPRWQRQHRAAGEGFQEQAKGGTGKGKTRLGQGLDLASSDQRARSLDVWPGAEGAEQWGSSQGKPRAAWREAFTRGRSPERRCSKTGGPGGRQPEQKVWGSGKKGQQARTGFSGKDHWLGEGGCKCRD